MKHTFRYIVEGPLPAGMSAQQASANALRSGGPVVDVTIQPHPGLAAKMIEAGLPVPSTTARLLIDTGAGITSVHEDVLQALGVPPVRTMPIIGVGGKPIECNVYRLGIGLAMKIRPGAEAIMYFASDVAAIPALGVDHHVGLIGRDFLQHFTLNYRGPTGEVEIVAKDPPDLPPPPGMNRKDRRRHEKNARKKRR